MTQPDPQFAWIPFYQKFADELLEYKDRRGDLLALILPALEDVRTQINKSSSKSQYKLEDIYVDKYDDAGETGSLRDICPFTVMASFNRGLTNTNRAKFAMGLSNVLDLSAELTSELDGIPVVRNQRTWFFPFEYLRQQRDIDVLWQVFEAGLTLAASDTELTRQGFIESYDSARKVIGVDINLTLGLYWIRPERFLSLDQHNKRYIKNYFPDIWNQEDTPNGQEYLTLCDDVLRAFPTTVNDTLVSSFPQLSYEAWESRKSMDELVKEERRKLEESGGYNDPDSPVARKEDAKASAIRQGQPRFRRRLLKEYGKRCAVTGYTANGDAESVLEACHIRTFPGQNMDLNSPSNGLLLRADIHTLFDRGLIGIDPDTWKVRIRKELQGTQYRELAGEDVCLPDNRDFWPNPDVLREHWKNKGRW